MVTVAARELPEAVRLLIKYPSRQRPHVFVETLAAYHGNLARPDLCEIIVAADTDDRTMRSGAVTSAVAAAPCAASIHYGRHRNKVEAINSFIDSATRPWDIVLLASDDMIPCERGYDDLIRDAMAEHYPDTMGALWWPDGRVTEINTIQCLGRRLYEAQGSIYHPAYRSLWCDNEATDVGTRDGTLKRMDRTIIRNESPDWGGTHERDSLYRRNNRLFSIDRHTYQQRKAKGFPA